MCRGESSLTSILCHIYPFKSERYQMKHHIRFQTELRGLVLIKWVEFLARNIKDSEVDKGLSSNQITFYLCSSLGIHLRLLTVWR